MCKKAALVLSRQKLAPCALTPWVKQTISALKYLKDQNFTFLTSTGSPNWDLPLSAAASMNMDIEVALISPGTDLQREQARIIQGFNLQGITRFVEVPLIAELPPMTCRDLFVLDNADILFPVSVRPRGTFDKLLETDKLKQKSDFRFQQSYSRSQKNSGYDYSFSFNNEDPLLFSDNYIIHWTRTALHPWPTERPCDFYNDLISSPSYPRTAYCSLKNILSKGRIIASNRHMACGISTVCLSGHSPARFSQLMKWRTRYMQMSFEPYGLGVEQKTALKEGIRKVIYSDPQSIKKAISNERWIYQSEGKKGNWNSENEYRFLGDFRFDHLPPEKLVVFCRDPGEAAELQNSSGIRAVPFSRIIP